MKRRIINLILLSILLIVSFRFGINFYHQYDANKDGVVDIKDMLIIQKYLIEQSEK